MPAGLLPSLAEQVPKVNIYNGRPYSERFHEILKKRLQLPVWEYRKQFMEVAFKHQVIVLVGETGSGKTTQVHKSKGKFCKTKDTVLFNTLQFQHIKNAFHIFSAAYHDVLV